MVKKPWFGLPCNHDSLKRRFGILRAKGGRGGIPEAPRRACNLYAQIESGHNQSCKGRDMKRFSGLGEATAVAAAVREQVWVHRRETGLI